MKKTTISAPKHLQQPTRDWFEAVVADYELDSHHIKLLSLAGEAWDRCQEAREQVAKEGMTYNDRFGAPRLHPAVNVERDARLAFARLIRELDLDVDPPSEGKRPPNLRRFQ
jgi:P27 family predicted phage terminase small subunit